MRELGAGSSGRGNPRNDTDRNLLIQPQLALSHKGETNSTSLRGDIGSYTHRMSTITRTNNGAITYEEKESMHLNTPLTFSRKAVKTYQTGQKGTKNLTPDTTQTQWTIQTIAPLTNNSKNSGFHCSLIHQIGLAPAKQPQLTSKPGEAPPLSKAIL